MAGTFDDRVHELVEDVEPVDGAAADAARARHARLLKPPGSLGALEELGARLAAMAGRCPPPLPAAPAVVVACGDHGVHAQAVSAWPQEITALMVEAICDGRAAVNAIADAVGARLAVLDVGVAAAVPEHPRLRRARVRDGTGDVTREPAMDRDDAARALLAGAGLVEELVASGADLVVPGDMGIANTTPAACLTAVFTGLAPAEVTGRGAGADDDALRAKVAVVTAALDRHRPDAADPLGALAAVGGLEHAALTGVILAAAAERIPVVLDGVASNAAALVATALCPAAGGYLVAGHRSTEPAATAALAALDLEPLLDLQLRLGEGTGGLLAVPLVVAAAAALARMGTLDDLGLG